MVIVGGGYIGMEVAAAAVAWKLDTTVRFCQMHLISERKKCWNFDPPLIIISVHNVVGFFWCILASGQIIPCSSHIGPFS